MADSLEMIATTEWSLGKLDLALKNYNDALAVRREIGDKSGTGDVLNDLAQFYNDRSQYEQALKLFKESLQIQIDVGNDQPGPGAQQYRQYLSIQRAITKTRAPTSRRHCRFAKS